jgi:acyl-CoA synthetase (AMP-forming)/AMP-acid ligase II
LQRAPRSGTLVDLLEYRAAHNPEDVVYRFLSADHAAETAGGETITYAQLRTRARAIAAELRERGLRGGRVLLLFAPGLDYITAFFGCLYAGVVAVPAYPPLEERGLSRLNAIASDARPGGALTTEALAGLIRPHLDPELTWLATDSVARIADITELGPVPDDLAFLQYTSGSTRDPRGVMLTHANLMHNLGLMCQWFESSGDDTGNVAVSWLPPYHDMGLIGGILEPVYAGFPAVLMSPVDFLRQPRRWLDAISRYRGTVTAAPNFAYELCVRKVVGAERETLDLSSWRIAVNGAEPVHPRTLDRFTEAFAPQGFRRETFRPSYGLAEATLLVTTDPVGEPTRTMAIGGAQRVACGLALGEQDLVVVDTVSLQPAPTGEVGEIWLSGPSVAQGYWGRETETTALFGATLPGRPGSYLRTGDLGVLDDTGRLFVTGRLKDVIIIAGRNIYPQDVENAVEAGHPGLRPGCGAAFAVPDGDAERLVVVQEATTDVDIDAVITASRTAVRAECDTDLHELVLIAPRTIPKTSSGKVQRNACRQAYLAGDLVLVGQWRSGSTVPRPYVAPRDPAERLLAAIFAELLDVGEVGVHDDFFTAGGHSLLANQLVARVREQLPVRISLGDVFEAPTVAGLAQLLGSRDLVVAAGDLEDLLSDLETN